MLFPSLSGAVRELVDLEAQKLRSPGPKSQVVFPRQDEHAVTSSTLMASSIGLVAATSASRSKATSPTTAPESDHLAGLHFTTACFWLKLQLTS